MDDQDSSTSKEEIEQSIDHAIAPLPVEEEHTVVQPTAITDANSAAPPADSSLSLQTITDKALHFLSHASNETLGACLVGLGATTYLVLGRVGLVIMGMAGGVVLHATWDGAHGGLRSPSSQKIEAERRRETGVEVVKRLLGERASALDRGDQDQSDVKVYANQQLDFSRFEPETAKALDTFANAVIKDYVHYWYDPTLPGELSFPAACKRTFVAFMLSLSGHLERKRPADAFLDFVTNASSIIIVFLNELAAALNASPSSSAEQAVAIYLELKPDSSLAHVLDQKHQSRKLSMVAEDMLEAYLDPKAFNDPPVHAFLKEVMAQLVLGATITLCSRPEWINEWIVYGLEESETTKEVMNIVDAGVEGRAPMKSTSQVDMSTVQTSGIKSKKEALRKDGESSIEQKRQISRAEEAMDEAMQEAKRLTQLMIEEDQRNAAKEQQSAASSSEDVSESGTTHGAPTPTSSQSDRDANEAEQETAVVAPAKEALRPATPTSKQPFTSFDQMLPSSQPSALAPSATKPAKEAPQLTLQNAIVSIFDDSMPGERSTIKSKPAAEYLIQIEPASSAFPGWMIARKYADFEVLHEVLRRISVITGANFTNTYAELPKWKSNTKAILRTELERYLTEAVRYQTLAESEGMKRFLEKDRGLSKSPGDRGKGFGWPTPETFGKLGGNMIDVLAKAPKDVAGGVAGGGKALFGNVAGLVGGKKANPPAPISRTTSSSNTSTMASPKHKSNPSMGQPFMTDTYLGSMSVGRQSQDSLRSMPQPTIERKNSVATIASLDAKPKSGTVSQRQSIDSTRALSMTASQQSPAASQVELAKPAIIEEAFDLPPPPSDIPDDYGSPARSVRPSTDTFRSSNLDHSTAASSEPDEKPSRSSTSADAAKTKPAKAPLNEQETSVTVELIFAVITELYTLSSAWQFRRTLLAAAKTFLLRPGNPQLASIRELLQNSLIEANLSDAGMAGHIYKMRENALPAADEMEIWNRDFPPKTADEKEALRVRARHLLVTKGMPQALTSVMGAAASGEALGKVFDCLQVEDVSRGLIFGLMLQALKVITH